MVVTLKKKKLFVKQARPMYHNIPVVAHHELQQNIHCVSIILISGKTSKFL